ncbi:MAG: hypothetical protein NE327_19440, partial [Lentisphaeraceae bacterium]|nr:hypothetical protein [Lentisphaeraceae bacterium]
MSKDNLTPKLLKADSWHSRFWGIVRALRSVKYIMLFFILALIADVVFQFNSQSRITLIWLFAGFLSFVLFFVIYRMVFQKEGIEKTARHIESNDPALGSSLINSLQLAEKLKNEDLSPTSKVLIEKALDDYDKRIKFETFKELLNPGIIGKEIKKCFAALALTAILCLIFSNIFKMHIIRYLDPNGDHPAFSLTSLEITSPVVNHKVLYNSDVLVNVETGGHKPNELFISYYEEGNMASVTTVPMYKKGTDAFTQKISSLKAPVYIFAHTRNKRSVSRKRKIDIIYTPQVEKAFVKIIPPEYTGRKTREIPYKWNNVTALKGSKVIFTLHSNRPLKSGKIDQIHGTEKSHIDMKPVSETSVSGTIEVKENMRLRFSVTDTAGNSSLELLKGSLTTTYDSPPTVAITNPQRNSFVTEDFVLKVRVQANDDYGVKELRLHRGLNKFYGPVLTFTPEQKTLTSYDQIISIPIKDLGVTPGDVLEFFADTMDNSPEQQTAISPIVYLKVISVEEYNDFLRKRAQITDITNKYEDLLERLSELRQEQEKINEEIAKLEEELKNGDKKNEKALKAKINKLIQKQAENNHKKEQLAKDFETLVREHPLFDIEKSFGEELKEKAAELRRETQESNEELQEFSKAAEEAMASQNRQALGEALQALRASNDRALKKLRKEEDELDEKILQTLKDLEKMNQLVRNFNYFVFLYRMQENLTNQLKPFDIVRDLSARDKLSLKKFAATEKFIGDEIISLVKKLRKHADEAEIQFPKAAASARELADKLEQARIPQLCKDAVNNMLLPDGPESYNMAEWIRREMHKMFNDSIKYNSPEGEENMQSELKNEFDRYLELMLEVPPMDTFAQMCQSAGFGFGNGSGYGMGGQGAGGSGSGYSTPGPNIGLLGNETLNANDTAQPINELGGRGNGKDGKDTTASVISTNNGKGQKSNLG